MKMLNFQFLGLILRRPHNDFIQVGFGCSLLENEILPLSAINEALELTE